MWDLGLIFPEVDMNVLEEIVEQTVCYNSDLFEASKSNALGIVQCRDVKFPRGETNFEFSLLRTTECKWR